jgi:hypothetical protein
MYTLNIKMVCACVDGGVIGVRVSDELLLLGLRRRIDFDLCFFFFFLSPMGSRDGCFVGTQTAQCGRARGRRRQRARQRHRAQAASPQGTTQRTTRPGTRAPSSGCWGEGQIYNQNQIDNQNQSSEWDQSKSTIEKRQSESIKNHQLADPPPNPEPFFSLSYPHAHRQQMNKKKKKKKKKKKSINQSINQSINRSINIPPPAVGDPGPCCHPGNPRGGPSADLEPARRPGVARRAPEGLQQRRQHHRQKQREHRQQRGLNCNENNTYSNDKGNEGKKMQSTIIKSDVSGYRQQRQATNKKK